jgi:hypothetical protein
MGGPVSKKLIHFCSVLTKLTSGSLPDVCIETGTYQGDSTLKFSSLFVKVHTIELSEQWYLFSKERLSKCPNVVCHLGDSAEVLKELLPTIKEPVIYFLDAHFAGGTTALGKEEVPLLRELQSINQRSDQDVLIIDDMRLMGKSGESGFEDDVIYPKMTYDWRNVTYNSVCNLAGKGIQNPRICWWDKIIIFRNRTTAQGLLLILVGLPVNLADLPIRWGRTLVRKTQRLLQSRKSSGRNRKT